MKHDLFASIAIFARDRRIKIISAMIFVFCFIPSKYGFGRPPWTTVGFRGYVLNSFLKECDLVEVFDH